MTRYPFRMNSWLLAAVELSSPLLVMACQSGGDHASRPALVQSDPSGVPAAAPASNVGTGSVVQGVVTQSQEVVTPPPETHVARLLALTVDLAKVHESAKGDCVALATQLADWEKANGAELRAVPALSYGLVERDPDAKQRLHGAMEVVMNVGTKCRDAPEFQALQRHLAERATR
jgi:hypothetical protein